ALGSIILAVVVGLVQHFRAAAGAWPRWARRQLRFAAMPGWLSLSPAMLYLVMQAVPFAPMRLSTILFVLFGGLSGRMIIMVGVLSATGTVVRMMLMAILIHIGAAALEPIFQ